MGVVDEVVPGLVLHLDPDVLASQGSTFTGPTGNRVQGAHFFMCIEVDDTAGAGTWIPLFSGAGTGRVAIDKSTAFGHPKWTGGDSYYHPGQVWTAPHSAVAAAAHAGRDLSRPGSRNGVAADGLTGIVGSQDGPTIP